MPKFSLKRRSCCSDGLSALVQSSPDTLTLKSATRMVSDEDIQLKTSVDSMDSLPVLRPSLKRRSHTRSLADLDMDKEPKTPAPRQDSLVSLMTVQTLIPEDGPSCDSPWGHFIDVIAPSPKQGDSPSFVPGCPAPGRLSAYHPYRRPKKQRPQITSSSHHEKALRGFVLENPDCLEETQDALRDLQF